MYLPRLLLAIFGFGLVGLAAELLFIEHVEDVKQLIPLALVAAGLVAGAWYGRAPGAASLMAFRVVLVLMAVSGVLGQYLHLRGNMEFERERDSTLHGLPLLWESLMGATPTLAPGTMVVLALVGYAHIVARAGRPASHPL